MRGSDDNNRPITAKKTDDQGGKRRKKKQAAVVDHHPSPDGKPERIEADPWPSEPLSRDKTCCSINPFQAVSYFSFVVDEDVRADSARTSTSICSIQKITQSIGHGRPA